MKVKVATFYVCLLLIAASTLARPAPEVIDPTDSQQTLHVSKEQSETTDVFFVENSSGDLELHEHIARDLAEKKKKDARAHVDYIYDVNP